MNLQKYSYIYLPNFYRIHNFFFFHKIHQVQRSNIVEFSPIKKIYVCELNNTVQNFILIIHTQWEWKYLFVTHIKAARTDIVDKIRNFYIYNRNCRSLIASGAQNYKLHFTVMRRGHNVNKLCTHNKYIWQSKSASQWWKVVFALRQLPTAN